MDLGLDLLMNPKKKTSASSDIISLNSEPQIINIGDYNEKPHIYSRSASSHGSRSIAQSTISSEEDDDDDDSFSESEAVTESEEAGSDRHNNNARHEHKQRYAMSEEEILNMKREILYQFDRLEAKGYKLPKKFSLSSNLDEMKLELERVKKDREIDKSIRVQRRVMMMAVSGVEMVTNKFDFIGVNLKGWSDKVYEDLDDYDDIFEELHDKYKGKAKMGPEVRLLLSLGGSAFMFHMTNKFTNTLPGLDQVLKKNPDLAKNLADATNSYMNDQQKGQTSFFGNLFGNFFGGGNSTQQYDTNNQTNNQVPQQKTNIKPPNDMDQILRDLERNMDNDDNISIGSTQLSEFSSVIKKTNNKKKQTGRSFNLDI